MVKQDLFLYRSAHRNHNVFIVLLESFSDKGFKFCWTSLGKSFLQQSEVKKHILVKSEKELNIKKNNNYMNAFVSVFRFFCILCFYFFNNVNHLHTHTTHTRTNNQENIYAQVHCLDTCKIYTIFYVYYIKILAETTTYNRKYIKFLNSQNN